MGAWWSGTSLVAERGLVESLRSRSFKVITALMLLLSVGAVTIPQLVRGDKTTYTIATTGQAPAGIRAALDAAGKSADFNVRYISRPDENAVRMAVRDGEATSGLAGTTLYTSAKQGGTFPVLVAQAAVALETTRQLSEAGLSAAQVTRLQTIKPPKQVTVGPVDDQGRAGAGFAVGIVLYLALTFAGSAIATTVATEKSTRISEVLLAVLRPSQMIVGTVVSCGIITLVELVALVTPLAISVRLTDKIGLPAVAAGDIGLALAWFVLGFVLYAFLFAATAALVDKITEVNSAIMPVTMMLVIGYMLAITIVMSDPGGAWSVAASIFPFTAPMAMPIRWASGLVPWWQLVLAMALTGAAAVLMAAIASAIYRRALVITGRRVKLREVIGRRSASRLRVSESG
jgi:ABC-2 type transport system permease protein